MFDKYEIELTLLRDMLGTNPCDADVLKTHIIEKQRKIITEKSKINTTVNKYLDHLGISEEHEEEEVSRLLDSLEKFGLDITNEEKQAAIKGDLESLRETFKDLDTKGITVFLWDAETNRPCISDHMIYGFMKAACESISRTRKTKKGVMLHSASYSQSIINQHVGIKKQFISFDQNLKRAPDGSVYYNVRPLRAITAQGPRSSLVKSEVVSAGAKLKFELRVLKNSPLDFECLKTIFDYGQLKGLGQWRNAGNGMFEYTIKKLSDGIV